MNPADEQLTQEPGCAWCGYGRNPARSCPECRGTRYVAGDFVPCRNPFHSKDDELEQAVEDAKHDDENWMRDLRAECARANRAEAQLDQARKALERLLRGVQADHAGTRYVDGEREAQAVLADTTEAEGSPCASDVPTEPS
jgi:hypothetical protein